MIISEEPKFIFVHIPRTGGMSIKEALGRSGNMSSHAFLRDAPNWEDYFSFCFVRNPWSRLYSQYQYAVGKRRIFRGSFPAYVSAAPPSRDQFWMTEGCSFVGRFEHLQEDLDRVCAHLGIPSVVLPHYHKSVDRSDYCGMYTDEMKSRVREEISRIDIENFGFSFEGPATKNIGFKI